VPVIDLRNEVLDDLNSDRGLLGVAVDPAFASNRYVYLLYTVDPDTNGVDSENDAFGRLVRYRMSLADSNAIDPSTRAVLMGRVWSEGPASGSITHTIAGLRWGRDGSLLVSIGDGAHYEFMDDGGSDAGLFGAGKTSPLEDIGAFRSQDIGSLCGKVLRIDPATGHGYPSNPFWDGDPMSVRSRVWAYGLRNPFRFAVKPGTGDPDPAHGDPGTLYIGDVGWQTWEEVDVARTGGLNFGWPCREGFHDSPEYQAATPSRMGCGTIGTLQNPSFASSPIIDWNHYDESLGSPPGYRGLAAVGGVFYDGTAYPAPWRGAFFYGDYGNAWIRALRTNASDQLDQVLDFGTEMDGPVDFALHPSTRDIFYIAVYTGQIFRIRYTGTVAAEAPSPPRGVTLSAPSPNPSRSGVTFTLELPSAAQVRFSVLDVQGREVWRGAPATYGAGLARLEWPGATDAGGRAPAGLYFARVIAGDVRFERRVVRLE
jgi:glucose/arabinose dehydrogenase